jgi:hypothetical protein
VTSLRRCDAESDLVPAQPEGLMRVTGQCRRRSSSTINRIASSSLLGLAP